jgi:hypothetical protein
MRPSFGLNPRRKMRNELMESIVRREHQADNIEDWKKKRRLRASQQFIYDTHPDKYNELAEDDIGGVMELGVLRQSGFQKGQVDENLTGSIIIGGKEVPLDKGKIRIVNKKEVDAAVGPILQERMHKDAIMSAILLDRSGRLCRMILPKDRYDMLKARAPLTGLNLPPNARVPQDVIDIDARPEFMSMYPDSSQQFALASHKIQFILDRTPLAFSEEISDWLTKYNTGDASRAVGAGVVN